MMNGMVKNNLNIKALAIANELKTPETDARFKEHVRAIKAISTSLTKPTEEALRENNSLRQLLAGYCILAQRNDMFYNSENNDLPLLVKSISLIRKEQLIGPKSLVNQTALQTVEALEADNGQYHELTPADTFDVIREVRDKLWTSLPGKNPFEKCACVIKQLGDARENTTMCGRLQQLHRITTLLNKKLPQYDQRPIPGMLCEICAKHVKYKHFYNTAEEYTSLHEITTYDGQPDTTKRPLSAAVSICTQGKDNGKELKSLFINPNEPNIWKVLACPHELVASHRGQRDLIKISNSTVDSPPLYIERQVMKDGQYTAYPIPIVYAHTQNSNDLIIVCADKKEIDCKEKKLTKKFIKDTIESLAGQKQPFINYITPHNQYVVDIGKTAKSVFTGHPLHDHFDQHGGLFIICEKSDLGATFGCYSNTQQYNLFI